MGLVIDGNLHRGVHGVAGEIAYMPISAGQGSDPEDARRRGTLEAAGSAAAVVRAARRAGMRGLGIGPPGVRGSGGRRRARGRRGRG